MNETRLAKALTKHYYALGAPGIAVMLCYLIPGMVWLCTGWLWELMLAGGIVHLFLRYRYRKDEYWVRNYIDALRMKNHLEP